LSTEQAECPICAGLPLAAVDTLNAEIGKGVRSAVELARMAGCEPTDVVRHANTCLKTEAPGGYELLEETVRVLRGLMHTFGADVDAGMHYRVDEEAGVDGRQAVSHYMSVMRELRETVMAMERLRSVDSTMHAMMEEIVNPLAEWGAAFFVEESRRVRDDLLGLLKEEPHLQPQARKIANDLAKRLAERFAAELVNGLPGRIEDALRKTFAKGAKTREAQGVPKRH